MLTVLFACRPHEVVADDIMLSGSAAVPFRSDVGMESNEDPAHSREDWLLGAAVAEEENEASMFLSLRDRGMFSPERICQVPEEATYDPADNRFSACVWQLRVSNVGFELTKEVSVNSFLVLVKDDSDDSLPSVDNEMSESNWSPTWMVFWLLAKLLSLCCCSVVCNVDG